MLDILNEFETDEKKELEGVLKHYKGASFLVARARNDNFMAEYSKLAELHNEVLVLGGDKASKQSIENTYRAYATTILLGWSGVVDKNKKPVHYSVEKAIEYLRHKDFFALISGWSNDIANYRKAVEAVEAKN